jgi:GNAT superfamily N-acetyltransferase
MQTMPNSSPAPLRVRLAQASDSDAIFTMVQNIWGGRDYVPRVWGRWLADTSGPLLVGTIDERPVALAKISALGAGEDWFHGLRVDPAQRGHGYARVMLAHCVALAQQRGTRTLRYLTDEQNKPMHHLADALGFELLYTPAWHTAAARSGASQAQALPASQLGRLLAELEHSPLLALTRGLYAYEWHNLELNSARLQAHLVHGDVRALPGEPAWAIVTARERTGWELAHIEGAPDAVERLCYDLRGLPGAISSQATLLTLLPPAAPTLGAMQTAGFGPAEDPMRVYELRFMERGV